MGAGQRMASGHGGPNGAGEVRLRPLGIGDLLDETFRLYRGHFASYVAIMAIAVAPAAVLSTVLNVGLGLGELQPRLDSPSAFAGFFIAAMLIGVAAGLFHLVGGAAVVRLSADLMTGRPTGVGMAYRAALDRLGPLLWASLLSALALGLLAITCLGIPFAIYLGIGWTVMFPALLEERLGGRAALSRGSALVGGHRLRVFLTLFLLSLLVWIVVSVPSSLIGGAIAFVAVLSNNPSTALLTLGNVVSTLVSTVAQALVESITWITVSILYFELRVRKEAFDLQQRLGTTDEPRPSPPTTTTP